MSPTVSWLNLLTPSAAIIAIFLAVALVVQSIRHGRQIRRIEQQISSAGLASYDPTLDRLKELSGLSERPNDVGPKGPPPGRRPLVIAGIVVGAIIVAGIIWALVGGGSSSSSSASTGTATTHTSVTQTTTHTATTSALLCANVAPVASPAAVTVSVYNGSGVAGAARNTVGPKITGVGYTLGTVGNAPGATVSTTSSIQYVTKADIPAACSIATALGVAPTHVRSLTVVTPAQAGASGVVVLVGKDIAH
jgi:hypothetical protein